MLHERHHRVTVGGGPHTKQQQLPPRPILFQQPQQPQLHGATKQQHQQEQGIAHTEKRRGGPWQRGAGGRHGERWDASQTAPCTAVGAIEQPCTDAVTVTDRCF